jgi:hypothetical protein
MPGSFYLDRAEWIVKYDSTDEAGNKADTIIFSVVLDDSMKPALNAQVPQQIPACKPQPEGGVAQYWHIPPAKAVDQIDGDLSADVSVKLTKPNVWVTDFTMFSNAQEETMRKIDTRLLGEWDLEYEVHDHAGIFGKAGKNNVAIKALKVEVVDITPPTLSCDTTGGCKHSTFECGPYNSLIGTLKRGYTCSDNMDYSRLLSTRVDFMKGAFADTPGGTVLTSSETKQVPATAGRFTVKYTCTDGSKNQVAKAREFDVLDTTAPVVTLEHGNHHMVLKSASAYNHHIGTISSLVSQSAFTCEDKCTTTSNTRHAISVHEDNCPGSFLCLRGEGAWVHCTGTSVEGRPGALSRLESNVPGTYAIKYTCTDTAGNQASKCRTVVQERSVRPLVGIPVLTLVGGDVVTVEQTAQLHGASPGQAYRGDTGVVCKLGSSTISSEWYRSSMVDTTRPGEYKVRYDCTNGWNGASAAAVYRTVLVQDTVCPTCLVQGKIRLTVEAGFEYVDPGAKCVDLGKQLEVETIGKVSGRQVQPV